MCLFSYSLINKIVCFVQIYKHENNKRCIYLLTHFMVVVGRGGMGVWSNSWVMIGLDYAMSKLLMMNEYNNECNN